MEDAGQDAVREEKLTLRRARAASRSAMTGDERARAREALCAVVLERARRAGWRCVAAYEPLRTEPASLQLLHGLEDLGARVLVPVTLADRDLDWADWTAGVTGPPVGREAVAGAGAVLVPAFAVDGAGMRLGRGGGSYDRALPRCSPTAETAALLFDGERVDRVPAQPWDRAVRAVAMPSGWFPIGS